MSAKPHRDAADRSQDRIEEQVADLLGSLLKAPEVEKAGIEADLVRLGQSGVDSLLKSLGSESADIRYYAAVALSAIGDPRAREPLYMHLDDSNVDVRIAAAHGLVQLGGLPMSRLLADLRSPDARVRSSIAVIVGLLHEDQAVGPLIGLLADPDREVRAQAAQSLGRIGDSQAIVPLINLLEDDDRYVRIASIKALGELNDPRAIEPLVKLGGDRDNLVRGWVAQALGRLDSKAAREALTNLLHDADPFVRRHADEAMKRLAGT